jgi:hypothetical protein
LQAQVDSLLKQQKVIEESHQIHLQQLEDQLRLKEELLSNRADKSNAALSDATSQLTKLQRQLDDRDVALNDRERTISSLNSQLRDARSTISLAITNRSVPTSSSSRLPQALSRVSSFEPLSASHFQVVPPESDSLPAFRPSPRPLPSDVNRSFVSSFINVTTTNVFVVFVIIFIRVLFIFI